MKIFRIFKKVSIGILFLLSFLVIIGIAYEQICRSNSENKFHPDGEFVDLGDHNLHYLKSGKGSPTVVFESGLDPGGHLPWFKVQNEISKYTTTISYDRAGVLWSERGNNPKTGQAMAEELSDLLIKTKCPKPYIIVGHSLAGLFLRNFIIQNQADISGVIFIDVSHPEQNDRKSEELKSLSKVPSPMRLKVTNTTGLIRLFYKNYYPNTAKNDSINRIVYAMFYGGLSAFIDEQNSMEYLLDESEQINSFGSIPLKIITGTSPDRYNEISNPGLRKEFFQLKMDLQKDLLNLSTNSEQIFAAESGHYVQLEQPEIVINAIITMAEADRETK